MEPWTSRRHRQYSPEVRERAVRMVLEHRGDHASQWAAIGSIAAKIGCTAQTLRNWVRQAERDQGLRAGSDDRRARADQGAGAREPRAAPGQRDPAQGVGVFCPGGARPPVQAMIAFIDDHRAPTGSSRSAACCRSPRPPITPMPPGARDPDAAPARAQRDAAAAARDPARVRRELPGLRRAQGLAAAAARGIATWPAAPWRG